MPETTMLRPQSHDALSPLEASTRVDEFIGAVQVAGDWCIDRFTVSDLDGVQDYWRSFGDGGGRYTPPGNYIRLYTTDPDAGFTTMMSNTPDEMRDHIEFMEAASGRVLVHGLGLSCVVSGLLANEDVTHIDVVEKDPAIISMVGPAYRDDPRVTIHEGDAMTYEWADESWDFAWHDIWAKISADNLGGEGASPEYGISYMDLLLRFRDRVGVQGAWALERALQMDAAESLADKRQAEWGQRWKDAAPGDERMAILYDWYAQDRRTTRS